ncbi:hypothetical protein Taro_032171 [Colocasia esculenta]|uniref:Uncharacterized protein n=1 Tax=Colocasia esculenta TaxID=4460 RepID=A0A843VQP4_COLES|nr:hypothetical protein [Colocasia esculenta]
MKVGWLNPRIEGAENGLFDATKFGVSPAFPFPLPPPFSIFLPFYLKTPCLLLFHFSYSRFLPSVPYSANVHCASLLLRKRELLTSSPFDPGVRLGAVRDQAEVLFNLCHDCHPEILGLHLGQLLHSSAHQKIRAMLALTSGGELWPRLRPSTQPDLKSLLLASVQREEVKSISKKLCDTVLVDEAKRSLFSELEKGSITQLHLGVLLQSEVRKPRRQLDP